MPLSPSSASLVTVVIDTREQEPYGFNPDLVRPLRRALPAGDYSVAGLEETIAVERKPVNLQAVIDRVVKLFAIQAAEKGVTLDSSGTAASAVPTTTMPNMINASHFFFVRK